MELLKDFDGALFQDTKGYFEKYFAISPDPTSDHSKIDSTFAAAAVLALQRYSRSRSRVDLLQYLSQVISITKGAPATCFVPCPSLDFDGSQSVALVTRRSSTVDSNSVLVLGLLHQEEDALTSDRGLSTFCKAVAMVFLHRSHRLFLHAFRIYDQYLEAWTFDRSGGYCGSPIDITKNPRMVARIMKGYLCMNEIDLGLNPLLHKGMEKNGLPLPSTILQLRSMCLSLDPVPIAASDRLVGRGTACFKGSDDKNQKFAVKFGWDDDLNPGEWELFETARTKNVKGIIGLEAYQIVSNIHSLRQGLVFTDPYMLQRQPQHHKQLGQIPAGNPDRSVEHSKGDRRRMSESLTLSCVVTSPLGDALDTFDSPSQLLLVLRDVLHALRSLYQDGGILHRDVSIANIIIVRPTSDDPSNAVGMLIDLNCALDLSRGPARNNFVGTPGYQAVELWYGTDHTYRHDLESLFYVFLRIAICHDGTSSKEIPEHSRLQGWLDRLEGLGMYKRKMADMQPDSFAKLIEAEFTEPFRPYLALAHRLHALLFFPDGCEQIFIKTDKSEAGTNMLYDEMSMAFAQAAQQSAAA